jgi:hypothetical protein
MDLSHGVDRAKVETLQRWVSAGHEEWCKDSRLVAMDELKRVVRAFAGGADDLDALPLDTESADAWRAVFVWSSPDGWATYRVTVERFGWLLPVDGFDRVGADSCGSHRAPLIFGRRVFPRKAFRSPREKRAGPSSHVQGWRAAGSAQQFAGML